MAATVDEVTAGSMVVAAVVVAQGSISVAVPGTAAVLASGSVVTAAIAQYHQSCPSEFDCPRNNCK